MELRINMHRIETPKPRQSKLEERCKNDKGSLRRITGGRAPWSAWMLAMSLRPHLCFPKGEGGRELQNMLPSQPVTHF